MTWFLMPDGTVADGITDSMQVIKVPVENIICMSTTHVAMISALHEAGAIRGISGTGFVYDESVRKRIEAGAVREIGYENSLNKERILSLSPDLLMAYGIGGESAGYVGKIRDLGVKVMINADYLETDPLGKAEWIKLFGALFNKEMLADSLFRTAEKEYLSLASFISGSIKTRPDVLLGLPFRDAWYISPGNSYISRLIEDAGGNYIWSDTKSSFSMPYGIENVFVKALDAEYWLNIGNVSARSEISSIDARVTGLPCYNKGNLYNNNLRMSPGGGNDYWESGSFNPHIILKDIASILHPDMFPDHKLVYYKKIE